MKRLIYFFICTLLLPISAKAFDFNKVRNDTIGMFRVDEIKVRPNCIVYRMTDIDAKKYSVVSTCKQYLMIKMTIFPSTSPSRADGSALGTPQDDQCEPFRSGGLRGVPQVSSDGRRDLPSA